MLNLQKSKRTGFFFAFLISSTCLLLQLDASDTVDFNRDVRPILSDKCFFCHGPDEKHRGADLRLDIRQSALEERDGVRAIVPGDLEKSALISRILTKDEDDIMPPPKSHKTLSKREIDILKKWVQSGAEYKDYWFYLQPKKAKLPEVSGPRHNAIDNFVQSRLETEGLKVSPEADKVTLIRRLYFDLIGLPPSPSEVDAFIQSKDPQAYEKKVDELLSSKAYGERMAIMWLDLVRYADTVGYHGDQSISQSPYRDYVIDAFNDNISYDQFTREQLAGDLFKNASQKHKIASAYNRLNMTTEEGGSQAKEYLAKYASDRVRNVSAVWMGSTLGCAECHDHKFDPFSMKDFYSFAAFFADIREVGVYGARRRPPEMKVVSDDEQKVLDKIKQEIQLKRNQTKSFRPEYGYSYEQWLAEHRNKIRTNSYAVTYHAWIEDEPMRRPNKFGKWNFVDAKKGKVKTGKKSRLQESKDIARHGFQVRQRHKLQKNESFYFDIWLDPKNPPKAIMLQINDGNWEHRAFWGQDVIPAGGIGKNNSGHRPKGVLPQTGEWHRLTVHPSEIGIKPGRTINGFMFTQMGGKAYWDQAGIQKGNQPPQAIQTIITKINHNEKEEEQAKAYFLTKHPRFKNAHQSIRELEKKQENYEKTLRTVPITEAVKPRMIRVLNRGDWMDESGEVVSPAIPTFLGEIKSKNKRLNRMDLANWLMSKDNPMTARVFMNNLWSLYFGTGISKIQEDLGGQGEWPSHLELLDWLAVEFQESGWDIKHMIKLIVMSHTYRQQSTDTPGLRERDPYNRLLARQSRYLLQAELIRDNALKVSGLLVDRMGGKSTRPYQPAGYYSQLNFPRRRYSADLNENQYRRGVYTWWQRTFLHPTFKAFNAPSREACTASRPRSNTPLQALSLMNDPSFVETARALAAKAIKAHPKNPEQQIRYAYREVLSQFPDIAVERILKETFKKHQGYFKQNPNKAKELISIGHSKVGHDLDTTDLASMTSVTRVLFNLHQTITRN